MIDLSLGERFIRWAESEPSIAALVLIGSQARDRGRSDAADRYSDWDFQVVTSNPRLFSDTRWLQSANLGGAIAYARRAGRLGSAHKATAILESGELDIVLIPTVQLRAARLLLNLKLLSRIPSAQRGLADLSAVLQGGFCVAKGARAWEPFFRRVAEGISAKRLSDADVCALAEGFVCDYISTRRKIDRGEMVAAQRWLHHQLAEANYQLLHELRLRAQMPSFPDARRLELLGENSKLAAVRVAALPDAVSLSAAVDRSAATCRSLVEELVGRAWRWPDLAAFERR